MDLIQTLISSSVQRAEDFSGQELYKVLRVAPWLPGQGWLKPMELLSSCVSIPLLHTAHWPGMVWTAAALCQELKLAVWALPHVSQESLAFWGFVWAPSVIYITGFFFFLCLGFLQSISCFGFPGFLRKKNQMLFISLLSIFNLLEMTGTGLINCWFSI